MCSVLPTYYIYYVLHIIQVRFFGVQNARVGKYLLVRASKFN